MGATGRPAVELALLREASGCRFADLRGTTAPVQAGDSATKEPANEERHGKRGDRAAEGE